MLIFVIIFNGSFLALLTIIVNLTCVYVWVKDIRICVSTYGRILNYKIALGALTNHPQSISHMFTGASQNGKGTHFKLVSQIGGSWGYIISYVYGYKVLYIYVYA